MAPKLTLVPSPGSGSPQPPAAAEPAERSPGPRPAVRPPLTPAQEELVELTLPEMRIWAADVSRNVFQRTVPPEELYAHGTIALQEAARRYQAGRNITFPVYARHHVRGRMIDAVRAQLFSLEARVERKMERAYEILAGHHHIDTDVALDDDGEQADASQQGADEIAAATYVAGILEAQEASEEDEQVQRIDLRRAAATLHDVERKTLALVAEQGMTFEEAAAQLNVHENTVSRRYASALRKLREFLVEQGTEAG